jgi:putative ABC transport system substrate-binding protein
MKKSKILLLSPVAMLLAGGLTACGKQADYVVGISQLIQHEALDAATQGFKDALQEAMDAAGKTISFDYQNAAGDSTACSTIANKFVSSNYDLIMANATPALQAAQAATTTIPILGTSITEYGVATGYQVNLEGIVTKADGSGTNISGTSDLADLELQAQLMLDTLPGTVDNIGIIYCNAEPNSVYQANTVKSYLEGEGKTVSIYTFSDSNDIASVASTAANNCDAIYVPTDNQVASNAPLLYSTVSSYNVPIFAGEEGTCKGCGYATLAISYYNLGVATGEMAAEILLEGADISEMPIRYDANPVKKYNPVICAEMGIDVDALIADGYVAIDLD